MLTYKHPKSRYLPHVQLSLSELRELCDNLVASWDKGDVATYLVTFQGTDGSEISTADVALITADNERVPSLIVQPTIVATSADDSIELRSQIVPATTPGASATTFYVLNVTGSTQQWTEGVMATTFHWLLRRREGAVGYFNLIVGSLIGLAVVCLVLALLFGNAVIVEHAGKSQATHITPLGICLIASGIAFAVAGVAYYSRSPLFSVVVRPTKSYLTTANVAALVGIVAGLLAIYNGVMKALGH